MIRRAGRAATFRCTVRTRVSTVRRKQISRARQQRLRIVVTAGPTREFFDSVRFISNPSSGKMGYAIAAAAAAAGHEVTLISGPVALTPPKGVKTVSVVTAAEMAGATKRAFTRADAAIFAAAVSDYRPKRRARHKLAKKAASRSVELVPTEDIAAAIGRVKGDRITIAFALEDHNGRAHAERKLIRKNCDAIVLNAPANVGYDRGEVEFLVRGGAWRRWLPGTKAALAKRLIRELERLATAAGSTSTRPASARPRRRVSP